jgi:exosortase/archaeosortase family protein
MGIAPRCAYPTLLTMVMTRTLVALGAIVPMAWLMPWHEAVSLLAKPAVLFLLHAVGFDAVDAGDALVVGELRVPWTGDCAGADMLLILPALAVWLSRNQPSTWRWGLSIALMIPAAFAANILRVLTLIGWRAAIAPAVEGPQAHYFLGLIWLVPFLIPVVARDERPASSLWMEGVQAAMVIALLPGLQGIRAGWIGMGAAVLLLAGTRPWSGSKGLCWLLTGGWLACGVGIAAIRMESFWLPWILLFPPRFDLAGAPRPSFAILLVLRVLRTAAPGTLERRRRKPDLFALATPCLMMPLVPSLVPIHPTMPAVPPSALDAKPLIGGGYAIRSASLPASLGMVWFSGESIDRHHSVGVCMKYRGVSLTEQEAHPGVFSGGRHWYREFFLHRGRLIESYGDYVRASFRPASPPGTHLIAVAPTEACSAGDFDLLARRFAREVHQALPAPVFDP